MKLAAFKQLFNTSKTRSGRRSMRVSTLLKKHNDSTLKKHSAAEPSSDGKTRNLAGIAGGWGVGAASDMAAGGLGTALVRGKDVTTPGLREKLISSSPAPIKPTLLHDSYAPRNTPKALLPRGMEAGTIYSRPKAHDAILAHEIGHANIDKSRAGRLIQNSATTIMGKVAPGMGLMSGLATGGSDDKRVRAAGVAAPMLATLPMVGYDGAASISALRNMKRLGANPAAMNHAKKKLLQAWGTYATRPAAAGASAYVGQSIRKRNRAEEKTAMLTGLTDELTALAEIEKEASVSDTVAQHSLVRYEKLQDEKPTAGQLGRGAAVGAALGPVASLASRAIAGRGASGGLGPYRGLRDLAATSAHGAVYGGLVPAARHKLEQGAELKTLKKYVKEHEASA